MAAGQFYMWLIVAYVLMSWFPVSGAFADLYRVLASVCEPYLALFRRFIPPIGALDISPMVAILVLQIVIGFLPRLLGTL
jgi:uncharacterized protein YggT (Ycf19 family)